MTLQELIELNKICFGVEMPKIRPFFIYSDKEFYVENLANFFIFFGCNCTIEIEIWSEDDEQWYGYSISGTYVNLLDLMNIAEENEGSIFVNRFRIKAIYQTYLSFNSNQVYSFTYNGLTGNQTIPFGTLTNNSTTRRVYFLEYDQKINMTI